MQRNIASRQKKPEEKGPEGMKCGGGGGRCTLLDLGDDLEASVVLHSSVIYANVPLHLLHPYAL